MTFIKASAPRAPLASPALTSPPDPTRGPAPVHDTISRFERGARSGAAPVALGPRAAPSGGLSLVGARIAAASGVKDGGGAKPMKVGVLLTSHGDIDDAETQLRGYVREAVVKNPGIPLPGWIRPAIDAIGWPLQRRSLLDQYAATGPTRYDENSRKQAAALDEALSALGIEGKTYVGYNFLPPFIEDVAARMRADGVTHVVLFNQGAQNSIATMGESIGELEAALAAMPDWDVSVTAVTEFNDDERFVSLLEQRLLRDAEAAFPGHDPGETLLFITSHGLPYHLIDRGDPATSDMLATVEKLEARLGARGYQVAHGFLNDDFFPGARWTGPKAVDRAQTILEEVLAKKRVAPRHVLLDGRLSFTVHHRATLYDADVVVREKLETPQGPPWARFEGAEVVLAPNFDGDPGLAELYAALTKEALLGRAADAEVLAG